MMKKGKKILSFVLAMVIMLTITQFGAILQVSAVTDSGTCGDNLTWTFDESTGTLEIDGTGDMDDWDYWSYEEIPWHGYDIKIVNIGNSVRSIGNCALMENDFTSITIPDSVVSIGENAFDSTNLTSITIPDSVTTIESGAFIRCENLTNVTISKSVTSIGDCVFSACPNLKSIEVDKNNPNLSVDENGVLFNKNRLIYYPAGNTRTEYKIPDFVTSIACEAFASCNNLTSITIPGSVTNIEEGTFWECSNLESVTLPKSVTKIGEVVFYGCDSLRDVYYGGDESDLNNLIDDSFPGYGYDFKVEDIFGENATIHYNSNTIIESNGTDSKEVDKQGSSQTADGEDSKESNDNSSTLIIVIIVAAIIIVALVIVIIFLLKKNKEKSE